MSGVPDGEPLRQAVSNRLILMFPDEDVLRCVRCNFEAPDVDDLAACPGCGRVYEGSMTTAAVLPMRRATITTAPKAEAKPPPAKAEKKPEKKPEVEAEEVESPERPAVSAKAKKDLASLETKVDKFRRSKVNADWAIGGLLAEIHARDLWQAAEAEYKSFVQYVQARFDIGKDMATAYLNIAKSFTEEQIGDLSITQLWHLARVKDENDRLRLLEEVRAGKFETTRDLAAAVKVKRAEAGLNTERNGLKGTVVVHARLKPGTVATTKLSPGKGGTNTCSFKLGDADFLVAIDQFGGVEVRLLSPET